MNERPIEAPNPTEEDLADPVFNAIWETIKGWDVSTPIEGVGLYTGATGSHVMLILNALRALPDESPTRRDVRGFITKSTIFDAPPVSILPSVAGSLLPQCRCIDGRHVCGMRRDTIPEPAPTLDRFDPHPSDCWCPVCSQNR